MKFGGLSEDEVEKIKEILAQEGIGFEVRQDQNMLQSNDQSMKNDLRHYNPPDISTHILGIIIDDNDLQKVSPAGKEKLLTFGISDQTPNPGDFVSVPDVPYKRKEKYHIVHIIFKSFSLILVLVFVFVMGRLLFM
jgi:hypothetical protein